MKIHLVGVRKILHHRWSVEFDGRMRENSLNDKKYHSILIAAGEIRDVVALEAHPRTKQQNGGRVETGFFFWRE